LLPDGPHPDNIVDAICADAISATHCCGVDVCSGIESVPGEKDVAKMRQFVEDVRRADASVGLSAAHGAL